MRLQKTSTAPTVKEGEKVRRALKGESRPSDFVDKNQRAYIAGTRLLLITSSRGIERKSFETLTKSVPAAGVVPVSVHSTRDDGRLRVAEVGHSAKLP